MGERTAAVLLEPVQGESGVNLIDSEVLAAARAACDRTGAALIFDEIQTGMGRTGTLWAYEAAGVVPDAMTVGEGAGRRPPDRRADHRPRGSPTCFAPGDHGSTSIAKALGGGLPIGALITGPRLADVLAPGDHGSTFAGGPVVAAAAHAALDVLDDPALLARVRELGERLQERLRELPGVTAVRGRGLMVAAEVDRSAPDVVRAALLEQRLVVNATGPQTIRFLPPLVVTADELDAGIDRLRGLLA